jgi:dual-specificity kinase
VSNGVNGVYSEDATVGQKRKRTTRKSARDEQKRREEETVGDAFLSYVPPPKPPIKAKDVPVPVIRDVSFLLTLNFVRETYQLT